MRGCKLWSWGAKWQFTKQLLIPDMSILTVTPPFRPYAARMLEYSYVDGDHGKQKTANYIHPELQSYNASTATPGIFWLDIGNVMQFVTFDKDSDVQTNHSQTFYLQFDMFYTYYLPLIITIKPRLFFSTNTLK